MQLTEINHDVLEHILSFLPGESTSCKTDLLSAMYSCRLLYDLGLRPFLAYVTIIYYQDYNGYHPFVAYILRNPHMAQYLRVINIDWNEIGEELDEEETYGPIADVIFLAVNLRCLDLPLAAKVLTKCPRMKDILARCQSLSTLRLGYPDGNFEYDNAQLEFPLIVDMLHTSRAPLRVLDLSALADLPKEYHILDILANFSGTLESLTLIDIDVVAWSGPPTVWSSLNELALDYCSFSAAIFQHAFPNVTRLTLWRSSILTVTYDELRTLWPCLSRLTVNLIELAVGLTTKHLVVNHEHHEADLALTVDVLRGLQPDMVSLDSLTGRGDQLEAVATALPYLRMLEITIYPQPWQDTLLDLYRRLMQYHGALCGFKGLHFLRLIIRRSKLKTVNPANGAGRTSLEIPDASRPETNGSHGMLLEEEVRTASMIEDIFAATESLRVLDLRLGEHEEERSVFRRALPMPTEGGSGCQHVCFKDLSLEWLTEHPFNTSLLDIFAENSRFQEYFAPVSAPVQDWLDA